MNIKGHHHHHVMPLARISPTLSHHSSLLSIAFGKSFTLYPVSIQSCLASRPTPTLPYDGGPQENTNYEFDFTPLVGLACLVRLVWMIWEMGGRWPYSCCFVGCCFQDLFSIVRIILGQLLSSFSKCKVSVHVVHLYCSIDMTVALKKLHFILSDRSDFHMTDSLLIADHALASHVLIFRRWKAASDVDEFIH